MALNLIKATIVTSFLFVASSVPMTAAKATILTYDDIGVPNGIYPQTADYSDYGGFVELGYEFNKVGAVLDVSPNAYSNFGPAVSGNYAAVAGYIYAYHDTNGYVPSNLSISKVGGGTFSFTGTYIKDLSQNIGNYHESIDGYLNNKLVGSVIFGNTKGWTKDWIYVAAGFSNVDTVVINSPLSPMLDNTYINQSFSPVPLPSSLPLFSAALLGLVGIGVKSRRKITA